MFSCQWISSTRPSSPVKRVVEIENRRSPPSFRAYDVRSFIGHRGHGVTSSGREAAARRAARSGCTDAAPSRCACATQSAPVSPPPITTTCLPAALRPPVAVAGDRSRAVVQVLHREVDAVELAARDGQVARHARPDRRARPRRSALAQLCDLDVAADVDAESKLDALRDELLDAPFDEPLLDLELGHAEANEAAGRLVTLVDDDCLAGARELLRAGEARRAWIRRRATLRPVRRAAPAAAAIHPSSQPRSTIATLDLLDRDGVPFVDLEHASRLAGRGAEPAGELGEVVRPVQLLDRLLPTVAVDEVVPVGDEVAERTAVVAERDAAFHAAGRLLTQLDERQRADELAEVADALRGGRSGASPRPDLMKAPILPITRPPRFRS